MLNIFFSSLLSSSLYVFLEVHLLYMYIKYFMLLGDFFSFSMQLYISIHLKGLMIYIYAAQSFMRDTYLLNYTHALAAQTIVFCQAQKLLPSNLRTSWYACIVSLGRTNVILFRRVYMERNESKKKNKNVCDYMCVYQFTHRDSPIG